MTGQGRGRMAEGTACTAIFRPGTFVFSLPGVMAEAWLTVFHANRAEIGQCLFCVLAGVGGSCGGPPARNGEPVTRNP